MTLDEASKLASDSSSNSSGNTGMMGEMIVQSLLRAGRQKRLVCGVVPCVKVLERAPQRILLCLLPHADLRSHIHQVLLEAFCHENGIHMLKVDSAKKVGTILEGREPPGKHRRRSSSNTPPDYSCVLLLRPLEEQDADPEFKLLQLCHDSCELWPQQIVELPVP